MPIKPENKARYPKDWPEIRARILTRAMHRCERCGVRNYELGGRDHDGVWLPAWPKGERLLSMEWPKPGERWACGDRHPPQILRIIRIVLTIAHLDHTPENCADHNLRAWCQRCHLAYDQKHHQLNAFLTRRKRLPITDMFAA